MSSLNGFHTTCKPWFGKLFDQPSTYAPRIQKRMAPYATSSSIDTPSPQKITNHPLSSQITEVQNAAAVSTKTTTFRDLSVHRGKGDRDGDIQFLWWPEDQFAAATKFDDVSTGTETPNDGSGARQVRVTHTRA
jgi:hypothetical protein